MTEVDPGRFLHLVFFVDGLSGFDKDGLAGMNADPINLSIAISQHLGSHQRPQWRSLIFETE